MSYRILFMLLFGSILLYYLPGPWYLLAFITAPWIYKEAKGSAIFLEGLISGGLLWAIMAWWMDKSHAHHVSELVSDLLSLGGGWLTYGITFFAGGLPAGLAAWLGSLIRR